MNRVVRTDDPVRPDRPATGLRGRPDEHRLSKTPMPAGRAPAGTPRSRVQGAAMIVAPALLLASTVASVAGEGLAADRAGGALQVYAFALLFLVVTGITRILDVPLPRASAALSVVGAVGVAAGVGFGFGFIVADLTGFELSEATSAVTPIALLLPGLLWPLTLLGCGLGLLKAGVVPGWSGALLAATGLLFPVSRIGGVEALSIAADVVFLVTLLPLGLSLLAGRDPLGVPTDVE